LDRKKRIAIIFGGQSTEHEVSRFSAESIIKNIDRDKFDVAMIGITRDGTWLSYDGPVEKIGTGEWEGLAVRKLLERKVHKPYISRGGEGEESRTMDGGRSGESKQSCAIEIGQGKNSEESSLLDVVSNIRELVKEDIESEKKSIDVVFPVLHGCNGEDGTIQGLFELASVPYVGSGVLGSALAMDKAYAKMLFERENIPTASFLVFNRKALTEDIENVIAKIEDTFEYPCFIKPANAGSSVGVTKARNREMLREGLNFAARFDRKILVEEFIDGREVECAVLGNDEPAASTVGEIVPCNEFYDYNAKYIDDKSKIIIPADLPESTIETIRQYAVKAFLALDCAGLARVDFFVCRKTGKVYINEINTLPGFTKISMYPQLWEASGLPYRELISRLIELAIERFEDNRREIEYRGK